MDLKEQCSSSFEGKAADWLDGRLRLTDSTNRHHSQLRLHGACLHWYLTD